MFLVDSHCHLDMLDLIPDGGDLNQVITRAKANGVQYFLNVCVGLKDFPIVLKNSRKLSFRWHLRWLAS